MITDPSYAGQIISFTYPHIGNYGVTPLDDESLRPWCEGVVVRELSHVAVELAFGRSARGVLASSIASRRSSASTPGVSRGTFAHTVRCRARSVTAMPRLVAARPRASALGTDGTDLVSRVTTNELYTRGAGERHVVAIDYGIKTTMVQPTRRALSRHASCPRRRTPTRFVRSRPDGVFLSNGPGDPRRSERRSTYSRRSWARSRSSASVSAISCSPQALGASHVQTAVRPSRQQPPGQRPGDRARRDHGAEPQLRRRAATRSARGVVSHVNLNDGVIEGVSRTERAMLLACSTTPKPDRGPTTRATSSTRFDELLADRVARGA